MDKLQRADLIFKLASQVSINLDDFIIPGQPRQYFHIYAPNTEQTRVDLIALGIPPAEITNDPMPHVLRIGYKNNNAYGDLRHTGTLDEIYNQYKRIKALRYLHTHGGVNMTVAEAIYMQNQKIH